MDVVSKTPMRLLPLHLTEIIVIVIIIIVVVVVVVFVFVFVTEEDFLDNTIQRRKFFRLLRRLALQVNKNVAYFLKYFQVGGVISLQLSPCNINTLREKGGLNRGILKIWQLSCGEKKECRR
jgi:cytochrome c biogenesis protein CcdA